MSYELKEYLNAINFTKKNLMDSDDLLWQKKYPSFIVDFNIVAVINLATRL